MPSIHRKIQTLYDVGLSYVNWDSLHRAFGRRGAANQAGNRTLKRSTGKTVYILDEPTTGLHFADVHKLVEILRRLSDGGNTVVVIEHNLDVIKTADYIIDMGPEGGDRGGTVIAKGTPEEVAQIPESTPDSMSRNIWKNSGNKEKALDANVENTQHTVPFDNRCVDICGQRNVVKYMASKIHMDENSLYREYLPAFGVCAGRYEL